MEFASRIQGSQRLVSHLCRFQSLESNQLWLFKLPQLLFWWDFHTGLMLRHDAPVSMHGFHKCAVWISGRWEGRYPRQHRARPRTLPRRCSSWSQSSSFRTNVSGLIPVELQKIVTYPICTLMLTLLLPEPWLAENTTRAHLLADKTTSWCADLINAIECEQHP